MPCRLYGRLPEVQRERKEQEKKRMYETNRAKAKEYQKVCIYTYLCVCGVGGHVVWGGGGVHVVWGGVCALSCAHIWMCCVPDLMTFLMHRKFRTDGESREKVDRAPSRSQRPLPNPYILHPSSNHTCTKHTHFGLNCGNCACSHATHGVCCSFSLFEHT